MIFQKFILSKLIKERSNVLSFSAWMCASAVSESNQRLTSNGCDRLSLWSLCGRLSAHSASYGNPTAVTQKNINDVMAFGGTQNGRCLRKILHSAQIGAIMPWILFSFGYKGRLTLVKCLMNKVTELCCCV